MYYFYDLCVIYGNDDSFKELAGSRPLSELKPAEEASAVSGASSEPNEPEPVTEEGVKSDSAEEVQKPVTDGLAEAEELEKYIAIREEIYKKAKEFDSKIIGYETAIRRPYFHVRPLNVAELENWHNYLDFMEREGDLSKVLRMLFTTHFLAFYQLCACAFVCIDLQLNNIAAFFMFYRLNGWMKQLFKREIELRLKHGPSIWFL